ncbi:hypothetical protein BCT21_04875 [Vibrio sp. 10N.222.55.F9]|uniref:glycosyl transferase n=1 Tax=Vibrio sp. 10N.222.55.F9 TaxID=1884471 RepID=UPI000C82DFB0|nr:glycosyl transferase [Vibrio sp. 10N.222.55.F9]PMO06764.1 hypothetical protein BCT21_04875 [Vibrio sp. 10N.222.55.F9]
MIIFFKVLNKAKHLFLKLRPSRKIDPSRNVDVKSDIVVTLTTYNKRVHEVHKVIESIFLQTVKPERVLLWLDEEEFDLDNIPAKLSQLTNQGLEIYFTPNLMSYKKIIPTIDLLKEEGISKSIVTIDDDIIYPQDMLEVFLREHKVYPESILCNIGHEMTYNSRGLMGYNAWIHSSLNYKPSMNVFPTGAGGVFYPKNCFHSDVTSSEIFMKLCPRADDVWLKAMSKLAGKNCKIVKRINHHSKDFFSLESGQDIGLFNENLTGGNDIAIKNVFEYYSL